MDDTQGREDLQQIVDALMGEVAENRHSIEALQVRADAADVRADKSEALAAVDREMLAELHADGILSQEHAAQMEEALRSSRIIGAAIGMIMASRMISQDEAFQVLKVASQRSNVKLRQLANGLVETGRFGRPSASSQAP